ncbi:MAG: hypothetical protein WD708_05895 [Kiritimatiellia bacterium]
MKNKIRFIFCFCLVSTFLSAQEPLREWKNREGKAIQARMLSHTADSVTLMLSKKEFEEYAEKELVLMEVDFPKKKKQSSSLKKANQKLQSDYKIRGYPTLLLMDGEGKVISSISTGARSPEDLIKTISSHLP